MRRFWPGVGLPQWWALLIAVTGLSAVATMSVGPTIGAAGICSPAVGDTSIAGATEISAVAVGAGGYLWVSGRDIGVRSFEVTTSSLSSDFDANRSFRRIVVNDTTNRVYAFRTDPRAAEGLIVDGAAQSTLGTLGVLIGTDGYPAYAAVDESANRVYAASVPVGNIAVIDGPAGAVVENLDVRTLLPGSGQRFVTGLAVDEGAGLLYFATDTSFIPRVFVVAVVDVSSTPATVAATIPLPAEGFGLALDEAAGNLYAVVTAAGASTLLEFDTTSHAMTRQVSLPHVIGPRSPLAFDPIERRLFLLSVGPTAAITEVDLTSLTVTGSVALQQGAADIALDAQAHRLYVGWTDFSTDPTVGMVTIFDVSCGLAPPDDDADGIPDDIDSDGGAGNSAPGFSDDTGNGKTTTGQVTSGTVTVEDVADPKGVRIAATSNAVLSVCGPPPSEIEIPAGMAITVTCGSVTVEDVDGPGTVIVRTPNGAAAVAFEAGDSGRISEAGVVTATSGLLTVTVDGVSTDVVPGTPLTFNGWDFTGFDPPVDNSSPPATIVLNQLTAGQTVPLKWHLADSSGNPVTTLPSASISVQAVPCGDATSTDPVEEVAAGPSGLINLGGGSYQLNWKTDKRWKGTCKVMHLTLGNDAVAHAAYFRLK